MIVRPRPLARRPPGAAGPALAPLAAAGCALLFAASCSLERLAVRTMADTLLESGDLYAADGDPELVREALPFALKTIEALLAQEPEHRGLLLAACRGFAGYAYAFVDTEAVVVAGESYHRAAALRDRARGLYLRGRDHGLRSLELVSPGVGERLKIEPAAALGSLGVEEAPLLYWTGAAWGGAISVGRDRPELLADLPAVRALLERALELDEGYEMGAAHEALIVFAALPPMMGGSSERAARHFRRAVELSGGRRAGPYVTYAENVSLPRQDRGEFEELLGEALAVDPDRLPSHRLSNLIAQRRGRGFLARGDELFLEEVEEVPEEGEPGP